MFEYILLIVTVLVLSLVCFNKYNKNKNKKRINIVFLCGCFSLLFIYSALRVNIGWDYTMYTRGFYKMARSGFETLEYQSWEYGFNLLTKVIALLTKDSRIYIAVISAVCLAGPFYVILRYSKKIWLSVLLYINLYFFYCTMNFLRQSIAISIIMFAYTFLINRKLLPYLLLILIASCFHVTALLMIPVYFLANLKFSLKPPILYCFLILWVYISSNDALDILAAYFRTDYSESVFLNEGLALIHIVIPVLTLIAGMRLLFKNKKIYQEDIPKILVVQTNLMYFSCFWMIIMLRHSILERFSYYTYIFVIIYIPELLSYADKKYKHRLNKRFFALTGYINLQNTEKEELLNDFRKRPKKLNYMLVSFILIITILYNIYGLTVYERGVHGVYPYQSWSDKKF